MLLNKQTRTYVPTALMAYYLGYKCNQLGFNENYNTCIVIKLEQVNYIYLFTENILRVFYSLES